jgi:branched-chain amino acid transport system permease protein
MALILVAVIQGILTGGGYALMASGLALVFGVLDIINVAQGMFVILGAYLSYALGRHLHLDPFVSLLLTMPALFALGFGIEWAILRRIRRERSTLAILALFAVAMVIEGGLSLIFTTDDVTLHAWYIDATVGIAGFYLPVIDLFAFAFSVVLLAGLFLLLYRTAFGYSLRATIQNRTAAELIGIDVERVQAITFGLGTALAGAGGIAFGATNAFHPASSFDLISRLLVIVVLGGMGSLAGVLIASLAMLVIGDVTTVLWSPAWSSFVFFASLILFLVFRPQGIGGQREGRKQ